MKIKHYLSISLLCLGFVLNGQDIHFSQYYNSPLNLSPALTGIFNGDIRIMGNYRNQWTSVPVDYRTFSAGFDMKYFHKRFENGFFSGGLVLSTDEAGDGELGMTQIALSTSYSQLLNEYNIVTVGFQIGRGQRSFNYDKLKFGNQFGDVYVPTNPTGENFDDTRLGYNDISAGINWRLQFEEGLKQLDLGVGLFHLNTPQQSFYNAEDVELPMRYSMYAIGEVQVNDKVSTVIHALGQGQGANNEGVAGFGVKYWLSQQRGKELALTVGTAYRFIGGNDAIIPSFQINYLAWQFGLSYDINNSDFARATNHRGGTELSLIYIITKVPPTKDIKACPVF